jgi:hypothetical protein
MAGSKHSRFATLHDVELCSHAALGERAAFGELVRRHGSAVRGVLRRMGAPAAEADDTAQDAFLTAFDRIAEFRGETLGQITEWYTGRYDNWRAVARANGLAVPNEVLSIGKEVKVPAQLLVRQDPLPAPKKKRTPRPTTSGNTAPSPGESSDESSPPALPPVIGPK